VDKGRLLWEGKPKQGYILNGQFYRSAFTLFFLLGFTFLVNFLFPTAGLVFYSAPLFGAVFISINLFSYHRDKIKREGTEYSIYENVIERKANGKTDRIYRNEIIKITKSKRKGVYSFQFKKTGETKIDKVSILDVDLKMLPGAYRKITCVDKS
jgi:hypothetical protein